MHGPQTKPDPRGANRPGPPAPPLPSAPARLGGPAGVGEPAGVGSGPLHEATARGLASGGRPRVPGAILLAGHVAGALPLWLAGARAAIPSELAAPVPIGAGLAVVARPCRAAVGNRRPPAMPADPLQEQMARHLAAALHRGPLLPPLTLARDAALALGAWPRAVAMALGGLRWAGPPPDFPGPAPLPAGAGLVGDGWPTPAAAARAAAFAALPPSWLHPLTRGLLLIGPLEAGRAGVLPPPPEWQWAARWSQGEVRTLARLLEREARWLAAWRRRLPADLPVDPRPRRRDGAPEEPACGGAAPTIAATPPPASGAPPLAKGADPAGGRPLAMAAGMAPAPQGPPQSGASLDPGEALAAMLRGAAALGRFVREEGLVPPEVAAAGRRLEADVRRLGWDPEGPDGPPVWPAWHAGWPVWAVWLGPAGAGSSEAVRRVAAGLQRLGWWTARLYPVRVGAHLRLVGTGRAPTGNGSGGTEGLGR